MDVINQLESFFKGITTFGKTAIEIFTDFFGWINPAITVVLTIAIGAAILFRIFGR